MKNIRIIPKLDIKGANLVKGINYEGLRVIGDPQNFAKYYYKQGADEIIYQDVVATLYQRNNILDIVTKTVEGVFIPLTVGGGIRTLEDIESALIAGADKVFLNTAALENPNIINDAIRIFGSSTIVISIESVNIENEFYAFKNNARENSEKKTTDWIKESQDRGAGEILLISIDYDGMGKGFDLQLIDKCQNFMQVPLLVQGGAGNLSDILKLINNYNVDAIVLSSMLHYGSINLPDFENKNLLSGNVDFIKNKINYKNYDNTTLSKLKIELKKNLNNNYIR